MKTVTSPLDLKRPETVLEEEFDTKRIIKLYRDIGVDATRFFKTPAIYLFKCQSTGYRFYYPFDIIADAQFYEDLSRSRPYYSKRWEHSRALSFLISSDEVLEIGSGFGIFLNMLKEKDIKARGLELNPLAVENCKNQHLDVEKNLIQKEAQINPKKYDVVTTFQVLEHITEVNSFLDAALECLKPGGRLIIGVPNNNPFLFINDKYHTLNLPPHHAGLWNIKALKSLEKIFPVKLEAIDFEPLALTYEYFINFQINNNKSELVRRCLGHFYRIAPKLLKTLSCKFIKGRNILVVFRKKI